MKQYHTALCFVKRKAEENYPARLALFLPSVQLQPPKESAGKVSSSVKRIGVTMLIDSWL